MSSQKVFFKNFYLTLSAVLLFIIGFSTIIETNAQNSNTVKSVVAQDTTDKACQQVKTKDITFAKNKSSLRVKQIQGRLEFAKNKVVLAKSLHSDTKNLESLIPTIQFRVDKVLNSYKAWLESAKSFDCTSVTTQQSSKDLLKKTHDRAWSDFIEAIKYYNTTIRPEYTKISQTAANSATSGLKVN